MRFFSCQNTLRGMIARFLLYMPTTLQSRHYVLKNIYWCPVKYWSNIVKWGKLGLYKTSEHRGLTFALCMVSTPLPLYGAYIIG